MNDQLNQIILMVSSYAPSEQSENFLKKKTKENESNFYNLVDTRRRFTKIAVFGYFLSVWQDLLLRNLNLANIYYIWLKSFSIRRCTLDSHSYHFCYLKNCCFSTLKRFGRFPKELDQSQLQFGNQCESCSTGEWYRISSGSKFDLKTQKKKIKNSFFGRVLKVQKMCYDHNSMVSCKLIKKQLYWNFEVIWTPFTEVRGWKFLILFCFCLIYLLFFGDCLSKQLFPCN